jgi:hypothetical protein
MTLIDELDLKADPLQVREISGSRSAKPGMLMGARIMQVATSAGSEPRFELSGAIYPIARPREAGVLEQVRRALASAAELALHADEQRDLVEVEIARAWLAQWFEPAPLPRIPDASTGDPVVLVSDF